MKFPLKIDYFDKTILMDLKKNFEPRFCKPFGIDEYLWDEEDHTSNWEDPVDITDEGYQEDMIIEITGVCYKLDKEGKVILLWYSVGLHDQNFPIIVKIPENLLELSHLKYVYLLCDVNAIENLPENIKNNDKFEVIVEPLGPKSTNLAPNKSFAYHICGKYRDDIDVDRCFELIIVRKDLIKEITSQTPNSRKSYPSVFLKNEIFTRPWKSD